MPSNPNTIDNRWYTDQQIAALLNYYFSNNKDIDIFAPLSVTGDDAQIFSQNLNQYSAQLLLSSSKTQKTTLIAPVNLRGTHWALLCFSNITEGRPTSVHFFDPFGGDMHRDVQKAIKNVYGEINFTYSNKSFQNDSYNCGPWVVEAARAYAKKSELPADFAINQARNCHTEILKQNELKSRFNKLATAPDSKLNLAVNSAVSCTNSTIGSKTYKDYISDYLNYTSDAFSQNFFASGNQAKDQIEFENFLKAQKIQDKYIEEFFTHIETEAPGL